MTDPNQTRRLMSSETFIRSALGFIPQEPSNPFNADIEYQCEMCKGVFTKIRSEDDVAAAALENGFANTSLAVVCDECYHKAIDEAKQDLEHFVANWQEIDPVDRMKLALAVAAAEQKEKA